MNIDLKFKITFKSNGVGWNDGVFVVKTTIIGYEDPESIAYWACATLYGKDLKNIRWVHRWTDSETNEIHLKDLNWDPKTPGGVPWVVCTVTPVLLLNGRYFRLEEISEN